MLRKTTELWRAALFASLGLVETACAANAGVSSEPDIDTPGDSEGSKFQCSDDEPYILGGFDTGRMRCGEGAQHRASEAYCPLADFLGLPADAEAPVGRCKSDADCGQGLVCNCNVTPSSNRVDGVRVDGFSYGGGFCMSASCRTDADCGDGALCVLAARRVQTAEGCPAMASVFVCQTQDDECDAQDDCGTGLCLSEGGRLVCGTYGAVCGRPYLINGVPRLAEPSSNDGWSGAAHSSGVVEGCGALIARHWQDMALAEHASIAAFARFTLQLLHLGAPLDLLERSQRAMLDETEHAKICFALATRYGAALAPGALRMDDALNDYSLPSIVRLTFREGCVGETVAALEAAVTLAGASDEEVRAALVRITEDERRHAELAWAFVAWALGEDTGGEVQRVVQQELESVRAELRTARSRRAPEEFVEQPEDAVQARHGVPSTATRNEARHAALRDIVLPCAARLVEAAPRGRRLSREATAAR